MKASCAALAAAALLASAPLVLAPPAMARMNGSGNANMSNGASSLSSTDRMYLKKDARGAAYELQISQLAAKKAQNPQVRQYAEMIVNQHEQANRQLHQVAQQNGLTLPSQPNHTDRQRLTKLRDMNGAPFDQTYVRYVKRANLRDTKAEQKEISSTKDPTVRQFVQAEQQMDQQYAQAAEALQQNGASKS